MIHKTKFSKSFHYVDNGTGNPTGNKVCTKMDLTILWLFQSRQQNQKRKVPVCLYGLRKANGYKHFLKDYIACREDEKKAPLMELAEEKFETAMSKVKRPLEVAENASNDDEEKYDDKMIAGHLQSAAQSSKLS